MLTRRNLFRATLGGIAALVVGKLPVAKPQLSLVIQPLTKAQLAGVRMSKVHWQKIDEIVVRVAKERLIAWQELDMRNQQEQTNVRG